MFLSLRTNKTIYQEESNDIGRRSDLVSLALGFAILFATANSNISLGQGRLILDGPVYMVIENQAKLVVENSNTNAITNTGVGGIVTESEFDQVVWKLNTATGSFVVPFISETTLTPIPLTLSVSSSGVGSGDIWFSTYPGPIWDNFTYRPSDVTQMSSSGSANNSDHVIDRFWIIDAQGYSTKPAVNLEFTYRDSEHLQVGNSIVESDLAAQRFHPGPDVWGDYAPQGITSTTLNTTSGVSVNPADFWRSWTLVESNIPLAIDLAYFKSGCSGEDVILYWETLSELHSDYFEIERLNANGFFDVIAHVNAMGGVSPQSYQYDVSLFREGLFRLVEVDENGVRTLKSTLYADCRNLTESIVSFLNESNAVFLQFNGEVESQEMLNIYDTRGRIVFQQTLEITKGLNTFIIPTVDFATGIYFVQVRNGSDHVQGKILKAN